MTAIVWTIVIGGVVGWLASLFMKTHAQMGLVANVVVGIVGSWLGFWVFGVVGFRATGTLASLVVRVAGAMLLIAVLKSLRFLR